MSKECFTCAHKLSRNLSKEEKYVLQRQYIEKNGRKSLFILNMEFKCAVTNLIIKQTDASCIYYQGDTFMEGVRKDISMWAKKQLIELEK
ncbi:MAG: hypothetical protein WC827_04005 [Candidatus Paceibacterota bacterium]|jgi:hypothetical protein